MAGTGDDGRAVSPGPFAAGMLVGALVGFALWLTTDTFVLFPAFLAVGAALGLALGSGRWLRP